MSGTATIDSPNALTTTAHVSSGAATLRLTVITANGCVETDDVVLGTVTRPQTPISGPLVVCPLSTTQFAGPAGFSSYSWTIAGNGTITGPTNASTVTVTAGSCGASFTLTLNSRTNICDTAASLEVAVADTAAPTVTSCPEPVTIECPATPIFGTPVFADNCDQNLTVTFTDVETPGNCVNKVKRTVTRTWTATDDCGLSVSCSQAVSVKDTTAPRLMGCPPVTGSYQCYAAIPTPATVTASDLCEGALAVAFEEIQTHPGSSCNNVITRTWTATDACGNTSTCTQTLTVNDTTIPTVTSSPAPQTIECPAEPAFGTPAFNDNCDQNLTVTFTDVETPGNCANQVKRTVTRTWTATDDCGLSVSCSQTITVKDTTGPLMSGCPTENPKVQCYVDVPAPATVTASDACDGSLAVAFNETESNPGRSCNNVITRTWTAVDACGNSSSCTQIITVNDDVPPTLTLPPADLVIECSDAQQAAKITAWLASASANDNCAGVQLANTYAPGAFSDLCGNTGEQVVTFTATDLCGQTATGTRKIILRDTTAPSIACAAPLTVSCASEVPAPDIRTVTASDTCGNVTVTHVGDVISAQTCANRYVVTRTYQAADACGNVATCNQIITVNDDVPPTLTLPPADLVIECSDAQQAAKITAWLASASANDNCAGVQLANTYAPGAFSDLCGNTGEQVVTFTATDLCGQTATGTRKIILRDTTAPSIACAAPLTVSCASEVPAPDIRTVTASDTCGNVTVTHVGDVISAQTCANRYVVTRTYQAADACGNVATCNQIITVNDDVPPTLTLPPADLVIECSDAQQAAKITAWLASASANDNCAGVQLANTYAPGAFSDLCGNTGEQVVTFTAIDLCGQTATGTRKIILRDTTAPSIACAAPLTVSCASEVPAPDIRTVTASDTCGNVTVTHVGDVVSAQTCANRYVVTRTYQAADACGNVATCNQIITVNDDVPPTLTCPTIAPVQCPEDLPAAYADLAAFRAAGGRATDNCSGALTFALVSDTGLVGSCPATVTRVYRVTDVCGNLTECTQRIVVDDTIPPVVTCPPGVTMECSEPLNSSNLGSATAVDNCDRDLTVTNTDVVVPSQYNIKLYASDPVNDSAPYMPTYP